MSFQNSYIRALDGIRGIAALAVMIFHAQSDLLKGILKGGFIGVDIFFVLSGFLITATLTKEYQYNKSINLKKFYYRRALRLLPALFLMASVFALFCLGVHRPLQETGLEVFISLSYLANWARAFQIYPPNFLGHTWSLAVEVQFYLIWAVTLPVIFSLVRTRKKAIGITLILAGASWGIRVWMTWHGYSIDRIYNGLDTRSDGLLIGAALGIASASGMLKSWYPQAWRTLLAVAVIVAVALSITYTNPALYYGIWVIVEVCVAVVIADVITTEQFPKRILESRLLVWIGSISYGLYLWHYPIFRFMSTWGFSSSEVLLIGGAVTVAISACSYYWLERPLLRLKSTL